MQLTRPMASCFTYSLGKSLYVPLTSRCNTCTLPETRGPNFLLPKEVVAALCRFRDAELQSETWKQYLDKNFHDEEARLKLPRALEPVEALDFPQSPGTTTTAETIKDDDGRLPSIQTLYEEVEQQIATGNFDSVVFAGEGEPTLRLGALLSIAKRINNKQQHRDNQLPLRVTTNGLVAKEDAVEQLKSSGVSSVSVALMTHDADQYDKIMAPHLSHEIQNQEKRQHPHTIVSNFVDKAISIGLDVEITAVERPGIDKSQTEAFSEALGVKAPVRWRPYFP